MSLNHRREGGDDCAGFIFPAREAESIVSFQLRNQILHKGQAGNLELILDFVAATVDHAAVFRPEGERSGIFGILLILGNESPILCDLGREVLIPASFKPARVRSDRRCPGIIPLRAAEDILHHDVRGSAFQGSLLAGLEGDREPEAIVFNVLRREYQVIVDGIREGRIPCGFCNIPSKVSRDFRNRFDCISPGGTLMDVFHNDIVLGAVQAAIGARLEGDCEPLAFDLFVVDLDNVAVRVHTERQREVFLTVNLIATAHLLRISIRLDHVTEEARNRFRGLIMREYSVVVELDRVGGRLRGIKDFDDVAVCGDCDIIADLYAVIVARRFFSVALNLAQANHGAILDVFHNHVGICDLGRGVDRFASVVFDRVGQVADLLVGDLNAVVSRDICKGIAGGMRFGDVFCSVNHHAHQRIALFWRIFEGLACAVVHRSRRRDRAVGDHRGQCELFNGVGNRHRHAVVAERNCIAGASNQAEHQSIRPYDRFDSEAVGFVDVIVSGRDRFRDGVFHTVGQRRKRKLGAIRVAGQSLCGVIAAADGEGCQITACRVHIVALQKLEPAFGLRRPDRGQGHIVGRHREGRGSSLLLGVLGDVGKSGDRPLHEVTALPCRGRANRYIRAAQDASLVGRHTARRNTGLAGEVGDVVRRDCLVSNLDRVVCLYVCEGIAFRRGDNRSVDLHIVELIVRVRAVGEALALTRVDEDWGCAVRINRIQRHGSVGHTVGDLERGNVGDGDGRAVRLGNAGGVADFRKVAIRVKGEGEVSDRGERSADRFGNGIGRAIAHTGHIVVAGLRVISNRATWGNRKACLVRLGCAGGAAGVNLRNLERIAAGDRGPLRGQFDIVIRHREASARVVGAHHTRSRFPAREGVARTGRSVGHSDAARVPMGFGRRVRHIADCIGRARQVGHVVGYRPYVEYDRVVFRDVCKIHGVARRNCDAVVSDRNELVTVGQSQGRGAAAAVVDARSAYRRRAAFCRIDRSVDREFVDVVRHGDGGAANGDLAVCDRGALCIDQFELQGTGIVLHLNIEGADARRISIRSGLHKGVGFICGHLDRIILNVRCLGIFRQRGSIHCEGGRALARDVVFLHQCDPIGQALVYDFDLSLCIVQ